MGIAAVILAILAIVCALFATFLFGTLGGIIAGAVAVIAIVLAILKRRKDGRGGIAGIVVAALAILLAFSMTSVWNNAFRELNRKAAELKPDGLWARVTVDNNGGLMGIINQLPRDEASLNAFVEEMNELNKLSGGTSGK